jgi:hypothetical protein
MDDREIGNEPLILNWNQNYFQSVVQALFLICVRENAACRVQWQRNNKQQKEEFKGSAHGILL